MTNPELQKVRDGLALTDEEIDKAWQPYAAPVNTPQQKLSIYSFMQKAAVAQAQLDKCLNHPSILIKSDDQSIPHSITSCGYGCEELFEGWFKAFHIKDVK